MAQEREPAREAAILPARPGVVATFLLTQRFRAAGAAGVKSRKGCVI